MIMKMEEPDKQAYIKQKLFDGIDLSVVNGMVEDDRRQFMLQQIERILSIKPKGVAAHHYLTDIYGDEFCRTDSRNSFLYVPHKDVDGWTSDLIKLLDCILISNPWGKCFSLRWLSSSFGASDGDNPYQFSPKNKDLIYWLKTTEYRRIAGLIAERVMAVYERESEKISVAIYDYIWDELNDKRPDCSNIEECNVFIATLMKVKDNVDLHIEEGCKLGLSVEEIGLIDSLWCEIPHKFYKDYVAATTEIWQKIKAVRDNFADGRKTYDDCQLFINDMVKLALPIAEKYKIDMELDDEHSLPLNYLKYWLHSIYYGNDPCF